MPLAVSPWQETLQLLKNDLQQAASDTLWILDSQPILIISHYPALHRNIQLIFVK